MSNRRNAQRRAAWETSQPRGRCTMEGLHRRPLPTTHLVKFPREYFRRWNGEPMPQRAYTCKRHADQLQHLHPAIRAYRYRFLPAERATRLSARRVGREMRRYFNLVDQVVDAIPDAHVQAQLEQTLAGWEQDPVPGSGGWCAPADITCACGSTDWPHECTLPPLCGMVDLREVVTTRGGLRDGYAPFERPVEVGPGDAVLAQYGPDGGRLAVVANLVDADRLVADVEHAAQDLRSRMRLAPDAPVTLRVAPLIYQQVAPAFADHPTIRVEVRPPDPEDLDVELGVPLDADLG